MRAFPPELIKLFSFDEFKTRTEKIGLKSTVIGSKFFKNLHIFNFLGNDDIDNVKGIDIIAKIKTKLEELESIYGDRQVFRTRGSNKEPQTALEILGVKRKINQIEKQGDHKKIIYKYREGFSSIVKRKLTYDFFL